MVKNMAEKLSRQGRQGTQIIRKYFCLYGLKRVFCKFKSIFNYFTRICYNKNNLAFSL